jgi:uncharacterized membrane protein YfcA
MTEIFTHELLLLLIASLLAGGIDAVVGGGGLIQFLPCLPSIRVNRRLPCSAPISALA